MPLRLPIKNNRPKIQLLTNSKGYIKALLYEEETGWMPIGNESESLWEVQRSALCEVNCLHNHNPGNRANLMSDINWIIEPPAGNYKLLYN